MTKIEWTQRPGTKGETWNMIRARNKATGGTGHFCTKVSAGCQNCYAADFQKRFKNPVRYAAQDADQVKLFLDETVLMQPFRWKKPRTIFVCSMTDLFYEGHSRYWIRLIWGVMALCPQHTFIVLTKRPEQMLLFLDGDIQVAASNIAKLMEDGDAAYDQVVNTKFPLQNVWLGTSVEGQETADERIPILLKTHTPVPFISAEPLLAKIVLHDDWLRRLRWVICGGESGLNARPMHPDWAHSLRDQCKAASVPFFFKQWGAWTPVNDPDNFCETIGFHSAGKRATMARLGKKAAGRLLDGVEHNAFPEVPK